MNVTPTMRPATTRLPAGSRRVTTTCKACGKSMEIHYPEAATTWKAKCPACDQNVAIALVNGRKCLIFDVRGHRTIERIGLTDQRRRFLRARCYACDTELVLPEQEMGRLKRCHKCGLEYAVREDGEIHYETNVRINEMMTTYREKTQVSTGYVANKAMAFFAAEEPPPTLPATVLEGETARLTAEVAELTDQLLLMTQERELLLKERELSENKIRVHEEAVRALDGEMAKAARLEEECRVLEERLARADLVTQPVVGEDPAALRERIRELEQENAQLVLRLTARNETTPPPDEGSVTERDPDEPWYCEEGEESAIHADDALGQAQRILGIRGQPTTERIKIAFRRRVKRYHPDRVSSLGVELRDLAHRKMQEINRAYAMLMKEYRHA
ncbi:MAG: DnaJ domain-containing protein [Magnetococcales bacterium]|nr:DnaJ domain-containing protein [Magnetococcales bacterium]